VDLDCSEIEIDRDCDRDRGVGAKPSTFETPQMAAAATATTARRTNENDPGFDVLGIVIV